jgi:hypothetical protein
VLDPDAYKSRLRWSLRFLSVCSANFALPANPRQVIGKITWPTLHSTLQRSDSITLFISDVVARAFRLYWISLDTYKSNCLGEINVSYYFLSLFFFTDIHRIWKRTWDHWIQKRSYPYASFPINGLESLQIFLVMHPLEYSKKLSIKHVATPRNLN